jgi:DNA-3-methyladenine glycosylase II
MMDKTSPYPESIHVEAEFLARLDEDWMSLIIMFGNSYKPIVPSFKEPHEALICSVARQQIHGIAAESILDRFSILGGTDSFTNPQWLLEVAPEKLRSCGFSFRKVNALKSIAQGTLDGVVPSLEDAQKLSNEELIARLTTLQGIGQWTVEMLLIFTLGRKDILPAGDFGIREGWRHLKKLNSQISPKELRIIGESWSPYRSTASRYLWHLADHKKHQTKKTHNPPKKPFSYKK